MTEIENPHDIFWDEVISILGSDHYTKIPMVQAIEIWTVLDGIIVKHLCDECKAKIRQEFREWLLQRQRSREIFWAIASPPSP